METILSTIKCVLKNVVPKNIKIGFIVKPKKKRKKFGMRDGEEFREKCNTYERTGVIELDD